MLSFNKDKEEVRVITCTKKLIEKNIKIHKSGKDKFDMYRMLFPCILDININYLFLHIKGVPFLLNSDSLELRRITIRKD